MHTASAQVVAYKAAPASQRPTILSAGNGVPLVNIQTPSAAGVSRNTYEQFDVQTQGVILNNSRTNTSTQLGGWVQGNPWLARGTARVILNEVISANPSQLMGYVEVAGSAAQVVIANPAGVTCNGCGFINASRATLTTGTPIVSSNLDGYRVEGGTIRVEGAGMDASRVGYTDLIARAVEVNAGIWAQTLKVTAGTNVVDAGNTQATPLVPAGGPAPAFAIDVASLGGMYAGKIVLVGTEAGVGVRNAGYLGASAGEVLVTADGQLTHSGSLIAAGNVGVDARAGIANTGTVYAQGDLGFATAGDITNHGGLVAAGNNATLAATGTSSRISSDATSVFAAGLNADGSLAAVGKLDLAASEQITTRGQQLAGGDLALTARHLDLADSTNGGRHVSLNASAGDIDLSRATTVASGTLTAHATQTLIHESARTSAEGDVTLVAEDVRNQQGRIGAGGALAVEASDSVDNRDGLLFAAGALNVTATSLDNRSGALQAAENVTVEAAGAIVNRAGLIRSGQVATLTASTIDNAGTLGTDQGIEGQSASLTARDINNAGGALRASANLTLTAGRSIENIGGLLSAGDTLAITDSATLGRNLAIANAGGTMVADQRIAIDAASLAGNGEILGLQDVDVKLTRDTVHSGSLVANRNMRFETAGTLDNSGLMEAGSALTVIAGTLNNAATGTLKGKALQLTATDINTLTNRGLINGTDTRIDSATVNNLGTGRIYGDTVSIAATTLTNEAETVAGVTSAPVIAARSHLDLGVATLANRDGALIFSAGDLAIGGTLDANRRATGSATSIENTSAGIESLRDLVIDASSLINQRRTLTITRAVYQPQGSSSQYRYRCDNPPKCSYWTDITETTSQYLDQVDTANSTPAASIRAGRHATLSVGDLTNRNSTIEAGGDLALTGNTLTNEGAELYRRTDVVTSEHRWHRKNGLKDHGVFVYASSTSALADTVPAIISAGGLLTGSYTDRIDNIAIRQATAPTAAGSGTTVPVIAIGGVGSGAGSIGRIPVGSGQSVVSANPDLSVPANSLYRQTSDPASRYLIETDPAFASYRQWISSDYMLQQLALDPATTQKRLGDGFYEQRLITEQIAQLTGRRFLTGYQSDEVQYQALMNAGATFAKTWQLIPGIALSAEQMAQLTSDIVWLVEKEVAGQKVLVPQVYARVQDGDLAPSGALLAGAAVNLETAGDLINSGRIAGRQVVALTAENIRNLGGSVAGKEISAAATTDLHLLGGSFTAENRLIATAGRNLTVESSTVDLAYQAPGVNGSVRRTDISRVAGLYVTGTDGTLLASAGSDLALLAAAIVNANPTAAGPSGGTTLLAAGNNLTLGTVTETRDAATSTKKTRWSESASTEVGTRIQTAGALTLAAGNDLSARAATVQTGGAIDAHAGRDLTNESGEATYASDYFRKSSSSGFLSKKSSTIHNTSESSTAIASTFSGDSVTLTANRDIAVKGSNVVATNDTSIAAGGDIVIASAIDTARSSHVREKTKSGAFSTGLDSTNKVHEAQRAQGSVISAGRDLSITAGAQINPGSDGMLEVIASASSQQGHLIIQGSALAAGRDLAVQTSGDLQLLAAYSQNRETTQRTTQTRRKLETLNFDLDQTRALLATLTAGNSIDLNVGGNVAAQIGSMDSSGKLQADRMTANGVIQGSDRQQVSLTHTDDKKGTTTNGPTSKVLGNLAAHGIRSGANDSFAPEALQSGQAAVTALMQNGLLTITNQPAIQSALNAPTPNGGALTYKDGSGRITLTLAGEAKVQAVYNQLKLTETFDVKHFADQGTAQVVTLVAAIALTVMSGGTGAAMIGATSAAGSAAANAAFIAMASTMAGQLAAGASFDEAFQVALKAGTTSAITAGILNTQMIDTAQGMQSINQLANVQTTGANIVGNFNADTFGQNLLGIGARGVVSAGVNATIYGGSFGDAFKSSVVGDLAAVGANAVGQGTNALSLGNVLGHAAVGCAAAAANGKDCASGAIGGAGAAIANPLLDQAIGGADGSGWGSNPETAQQWQTAALQLGSMAASTAAAAALGKDGMTAALAAQNETVNNYLTKNQIDQKKGELSACKSVAECKTVEDKWKTIDRKQTAEAQACLANGTCGSVMMTADTIKQIRDELQQTCAAFCSADALASLKELNGYFLPNGDVNQEALRTGQVDWGRLTKAGINFAGSVAGAGTGAILTVAGGTLVLAPEPTGISKPAGALTAATGAATLADSSYGIYSNAVNLYRATQGSVVYLPDSGTGRLAEWLAPGSQTAQDFAQIGSLGLAFMAGRVYVGTTLRYGDSAFAQYVPTSINGMLDAGAAAPSGALKQVLIPNTNPGKSIASWYLDTTQLLQAGYLNIDSPARIFNDVQGSSNK